MAAGWTVGWRISLDVEGITKSAGTAVVGGNHKLKQIGETNYEID